MAVNPLNVRIILSKIFVKPLISVINKKLIKIISVI